MSRPSSTRAPAPKVSPRLVATAFFAGALAVPLFHQVLFLLLYLLGVIPLAPFSLEPTKPFGVPEVVSASFWGGVWGVVFCFDVASFLPQLSLLARVVHYRRIGTDFGLHVRRRAAQDRNTATGNGRPVHHWLSAKRGVGDRLGLAVDASRPYARAAYPGSVTRAAARSKGSELSRVVLSRQPTAPQSMPKR